MVGFPAKDEAAFGELLDFANTVVLNAWAFLPTAVREGTPAEPLGDPVSAAVKQERMEKVMQPAAGDLPGA
ncbi:MAG: hypothetical protein U5N26_08140 [Candidatus Marinimicrobia bacterium]|nr:hypothetical protein [Candidatus Neomarinimicrobiota bacterium]